MNVVKYVLCLLGSVLMSESFIYLCDNIEMTDVETVIIFIAYMAFITKGVTIFLKGELE